VECGHLFIAIVIEYALKINNQEQRTNISGNEEEEDDRRREGALDVGARWTGACSATKAAAGAVGWVS
jgi:hypothetical protein